MTPARLTLYPDHTIAPLSPLLFGGFIEHLGRCVYGGLYDPDSPNADKDGYRTDVQSALADLNLATLRYPGGNYVSGHDWRDSVGPREHRPRRRELAWQSIETNQFGLNEFLTYCRRLHARPMLGLNFGTASLADTSDLVEYCNAPRGTKYADLRALHGHPDPHDVKLWCLGNEMDGPWQIGQMDAAHYAKRALETAKIIKWHSPDARTIVCGSSAPDLPTYPDWDRTVLETCWDKADYLSMHHYAANWTNDTPSFLAYGAALEDHLKTIEAALRYVKAKLRSKHDVHISWDEWNVWYKDRNGDGHWQEAPHLCEEVYNLEDALVVAQWLNLFLRHADTVKITCLAQVVNVISPLLTTRDKLLKQSTYYPIALVTRYAHGTSLSPPRLLPHVLDQAVRRPAPPRRRRHPRPGHRPPLRLRRQPQPRRQPPPGDPPPRPGQAHPVFRSAPTLRPRPQGRQLLRDPERCGAPETPPPRRRQLHRPPPPPAPLLHGAVGHP